MVRRLPIMSPILPNMGVATAAVSSQAVRVQVTTDGVVPRSRWMVGSTGTSSDWSSAKAPILMASTGKTAAEGPRSGEFMIGCLVLYA